jgi:hypothetical protein
MFGSFPGLFAACHVLRRLLAPRHPPYALISLARCSRSLWSFQGSASREVMLLDRHVLGAKKSRRRRIRGREVMRGSARSPLREDPLRSVGQERSPRFLDSLRMIHEAGPGRSKIRAAPEPWVRALPGAVRTRYGPFCCRLHTSHMEATAEAEQASRAPATRSGGSRSRRGASRSVRTLARERGPRASPGS